MNRTLWKKAIRDARWQLVASAVAMYGFCWLAVWMTSFLNVEQFKTILEQLPAEWESLSPVPWERVSTFSGRIAFFFEHPIVVLIIIVWAVGRGSDAVSGPLGRGTLEMVLAQPISRLRLLAVHGAVTVIGIALLSMVAFLGVYTGVQTTSVEETPTPTLTIPLIGVELPLPFGDRTPRRVPMSEKVNPRDFLPAAVNLFSLGFFFAGLATLMSPWDRYRWRTIGIVVGIYVVQAVFKVIALTAEPMSWLSYFTIFTAYEPQSFVTIAISDPQNTWSLTMLNHQEQWMLGPLGCTAILVGGGLVCFAAAAVVFSRRDLPAPL